jgi:hypothetical protein
MHCVWGPVITAAIGHTFIAGTKGVLIPDSVGATADKILSANALLPPDRSVGSVGSAADELARAAITSAKTHLPRNVNRSTHRSPGGGLTRPRI